MKRDKIRNESLFILQNETYEDSVIPFIKKELNRDVKIFQDVDVLGGIFANNLEISAKRVFIRDSVFVKNALNIKTDNGSGEIWFNSIVASDSILIDNKSEIKVRFLNSINSETVNLKNTIVYGNVFSNNVIIEDSIILGTIYCKNNLEINNSILGAFHTNFLSQKGKFGLIHNFGMSQQKPEIVHDIFSLNLLAYNGKKQDTIYKISEKEIFPHFEEETNKKGYIISPSMRIFDLHSFEEILETNRNKIVYLTNLASVNGKDDIDKFNDVEIPLFSLLERKFEVKSKLPKSNFQEIEIVESDTFTEEYEIENDIGIEDFEEDNNSEEVLDSMEMNNTDSTVDKIEESNLLIKEKENVNDKKKCGSCGELMEKNMLFCTNCGKHLP